MHAIRISKSYEQVVNLWIIKLIYIGQLTAPILKILVGVCEMHGKA